MVKYENGKIYKLVNDELGLTYYGSTCSELRKRFWAHKARAKFKHCTSHKLFESGICKIYLVEKVSCEDKMELTKRERFYIENYECVNKKIPNRTDKEYYLKKKDIISEKHKLKITCECGSVIRKCAIARHKKSIKHQTFLQNKIDI